MIFRLFEPTTKLFEPSTVMRASAFLATALTFTFLVLAINSTGVPTTAGEPLMVIESRVVFADFRTRTVALKVF